MEVLPMLNDLTVIFFDLLIFTQMISLRRNSAGARTVMYAGCAVIIVGYFLAVYHYAFPPALSSMLCMSLPSLLLFFLLSKHRDGRFFLTFCFVDTVSLIIAFLGRYAGILAGSWGDAAALFVTLLLFTSLFVVARPYMKQYHALLETVSSGWGSLAVAAALIYFGQTIFAAYPKPLMERLEYVPVYLLFSLIVISFYVVFIQSIVKTHRILEQNKRLQQEQVLYHIAFTDALTGLPNRASYTETINTLERTRGDYASLCCVVMDMNGLKVINDTQGHLAGDSALQTVAEALCHAFDRKEHTFRIGGDEFCVFMQNTDKNGLAACLASLEQHLARRGDEQRLPLSVSVGYAFLAGDEDSVERMFDRADKQMYEQKQRYHSQMDADVLG